MLALSVLLFLVVIALLILYLVTLQRALERCAPQNRTTTPGMVWLQLVPLVGLAWIFVNIINVARSLENEYRSRGLRVHRPGQSLGIAAGACLVGGYALMLFADGLSSVAASPVSGDAFLSTESPLFAGLELIASLVALGGLVTCVIYWIRIARYSKELKAAPLWRQVPVLPGPPFAGAQACPRCGAVLAQGPFCPGCGTYQPPPGYPPRLPS